MRRAIETVALVVLLAGPAAVGFFEGGFFDEPRLWAGIGAWLLVAVAALVMPRPLPPSPLALGALAALALLAGWVALSLTWAPLASRAFDDLQRIVLYLGALVAAVALLQRQRSARLVEPALAAGLTLLVLYGLSERLLPDVFDLPEGGRSFGRLDQPLTYWNAMGITAALALVLVARMAGDASRPASLRGAAAAFAAPLGAGLYLTFSRGAMGALAVGVIALLALAPMRPQLRGVGIVLGTGLLCAAVASLLPWVESLEAGAPRRDGALMLVVMAAAAAAAAAAQLVATRKEQTGRLSTKRLALPGWTTGALAAALAVVVVLVVMVSGSTGEPPAPGADPSRLSSLDTPRYDYWEVALDSFAASPIEGVGAGGFRVEWRREREVREGASDAHSLYLETLAELGVVGFALLALFLAAVVAAGRRAYAAAPALATGPAAALVAWAFHAGLDWDWEMPAVTLPALVLAGLLLATPTGARGGATRSRS